MAVHAAAARPLAVQHAPRFHRETPTSRLPQAETPKTGFANVFQSLTTEMDRGEAAMHAITRGGAGAAQLSTTELLALQAQVYRYSEAVDLAAKLVDRASNGVKTLLTGQ